MIAPLQTTLDPAGPQAARIHALDRAYVVVLLIVFVLVLGALAAALLRKRTAVDHARLPTAEDPNETRTHGRNVGIAVGLSIVVLLALLVSSVATGKALNWGEPKDALVVSIRGHQWWWEVQYLDPLPSRIVKSANELHLPVGRPVRLELTSADVIHSLWIPNLHGKTDLIPGHANVTVLQVDRPGEYRAQCAEFCGHQHAKMAFVVVAHEPAEFDAWLDAQRVPPSTPTDPLLVRGQQAFLRGTCPMCHTIQGTPAQATVGPDLTRVGSRKTLAAGAIPNTPGDLAGWIVDPTGIKPGTRMPSNVLPGEDLQALVAYLGSLR